MESTPSVAGGLATIEMLDKIELPANDPVQLAAEYNANQQVTETPKRPIDDKIGSKERFWVLDSKTDTYTQVDATLQLVLDHALVYVQDGLPVDQQALEQSSRAFNDRIYPRDREIFGEEWSPGIDGDQRLTILNCKMTGGVAGYFYSPDEVPRSANRYSNEREMFYMDPKVAGLGTEFYLQVLAHEFQHMIHWNQMKQGAIWFNEGLSELAPELNGLSSDQFERAYIAAPDLQLTDWRAEPGENAGHYGAAHLFLSYFNERYGNVMPPKELIRAKAGDNLHVFADAAHKTQPAVRSFDDLFADWAVANLVDDQSLAGGRWSYRALPKPVKPVALDSKEVKDGVAQYGVDYVALAGNAATGSYRFDGSDNVNVDSAANRGIDGTVWWSNRGDVADTTLTGRVDLSRTAAATLKFRVWYDTEKNYDFGFVSVSEDGGKSWRTLKGRYTTNENTIGHNYGHGYTGASGGGAQAAWEDESIDLTPFAGKQVLIRFSMITDDAFSKTGMMIDNIRIPEIGFADGADKDTGFWQAAGWVRTDNKLPQRWQLRLVRADANGKPGVETIPLDSSGRATIKLGAGERAVLVVMATTPHTTERASYTLTPGAPAVSGRSSLGTRIAR